MQSFFRAPTVRGLAQHLEGLTAAADALPLLPRGGAALDLLSFAQQRFWFLERFDPGSALYHIPAALRLSGRLDVGALQRAVDAIAARHEVLRTALVSTEDGGMPVVRPAGPVPLGVVPGRGLPAPEVARLLEQRARVPFDLASGMMLRVTVVELGDDDQIVLFLFHHIAADGWSLDVFHRELAALYEAFAGGEPAPELPRLPLQYADFAAWQRRLLAGGALDVQLAYWKKQLQGIPASLELPLDMPRPEVLSVRGATRSLELPRDLPTSLHALARQAGATLFVTLLAAFQALLSRLSGQADVCVGTPVAGRTRLETENLIGPFVNTLVIRGDLSGDPSFLELCGRVREATLAAYAHQDVPFERLVEELAPARTTRHSPLFQVLFVLQNAEREPLALPGLDVSPVAIDTGIAKYDLTLWMRERGGPAGGLHALLEYNTDLFQATTVDRMLAALGLLLSGAALHPATRVGALPLLPGPVRVDGDSARPRSSADGARAVPPPAPATVEDSAPRLVPGNALEAGSSRCGSRSSAYGPSASATISSRSAGTRCSLRASSTRSSGGWARGSPSPSSSRRRPSSGWRRILRRKGWSASWSSLVAIQTGGSRPPFFCVHAVGGNILNYRLLARHLGPDQPFYALQSRASTASTPPTPRSKRPPPTTSRKSAPSRRRDPTSSVARLRGASWRSRWRSSSRRKARRWGSWRSSTRKSSATSPSPRARGSGIPAAVWRSSPIGTWASSW